MTGKEIVQVLLPGFGMGILVPFIGLSLILLHIKTGLFQKAMILTVGMLVWFPLLGMGFLEESRETYQYLQSREDIPKTEVSAQDLLVMETAWDDGTFSASEVETFGKFSRYVPSDVHKVLIQMEIGGERSAIIKANYEQLLSEMRGLYEGGGEDGEGLLAEGSQAR